VPASAPLSPTGAPALPLRLLCADRVFPDGSAELVYTPGSWAYFPIHPTSPGVARWAAAIRGAAGKRGTATRPAGHFPRWPAVVVYRM